ncbi:ATP-binding protein [Nonomuraea typhae]|uniref:ATP-binding protein n=1 Tax=Nonomuraea typhae TaxID=2603600 RepID=UPI0012F8AAED|nr:helix-turn-helix transcriptional regulator [Nonomuraea typhae]
MLWGRESEQAAVDRLLGKARAGSSGVMVLRGDPGIGKTSLLGYAGSAATGLRVLRGAGIEAEADLPFAGLHLLLHPFLDRLARLPQPQADALRGAFGLGPAAADRFLIGLGVLSLLSELAEEGGLLCLVDDAHWLDHASADALVIAARRLDADGVALVFAARDPGFPAPGLPEVRLGALPPDDAAQLLDATAGDLPIGLRHRVLAEADGNPLALVELPKSLGQHPLSGRLQEAFEHRANALPATARTLLTVAALDGTGDLETILAAGAELGTNPAGLETIRASGLVAVEGRRLQFRHPLVRAAVQNAAGEEVRLAVHAALAGALRDPRDADRRAWHRAAAATAPDEELAEELEGTARRAAERGGGASASAAYQRAAELSVEEEDRARRLTLAAEAAEYGGRFDQARAIAEHACGPSVEPDLHSRLMRVRACSYYGMGLLPSAHALLSAGVDHVAESDPQAAAWLLLDASSLVWLDGDRDMAVTTARQLAGLRVPEDDPARPVYQLCRWFAALALGRPVEGLPPLPEVIAAAQEMASLDRRGLLLVAGLGLAEPGRQVHDLVTRFTSAIREESRVGLLPQALSYLAGTQFALGWHADARAHAGEAVRIAVDTAQPQWAERARWLLARLGAIEGDEAACEGFGDAQALLELGLGRTEAALLAFEDLVYGRARDQMSAMRVVPDLVEAAVRCGRAARAVEPLARFTEWAAILDQSWAHALAHRCRALIEPAEEHFTTALALHTQPFEKARTQVLYGEWLRRARRRVDARKPLSSALQTFERLGAHPWSARARAELDAAGWATPRSGACDPLAALTPQERQIVQLAGRGLANREIAARLFLSPRTVAQHLYKAFPKLGVSSRTELAALSDL